MTAHDVQTAATAPETGAVPEPAHGAEIIVPLNRLKASPRNARKVRHSAAAIEALAASIRAKGVLQAPVVEVERDREGAATGNYLVTIGEGRRQALRMLVKRKAIRRTHPVKVVVDRGFSAINPPLGFGGPPAGVIAFEEGLAYIATLPPHLDPPRS